jgi:hypothetical protein
MIVVQYHVGEISDKRQACIDQLRASLPATVGYEMIREPIKLIEHSKAMFLSETVRRDSGLARLQLLLENPDRIWIDTDVTVNKWPEFTGTDLYGGSCPACVMYLKSSIDKVPKILEEFAKRNLLCLHHWLYGLKYSTIPESCFNHLKLGGL